MQAQGRGVEESESWARDVPISADEARKMLAVLKSKLTRSEIALRERAFEQAMDFIARAETQGGVRGPVTVSYPTPGRPDHRRVDIEIWTGVAFTPAGAEDTQV